MSGTQTASAQVDPTPGAHASGDDTFDIEYVDHAAPAANTETAPPRRDRDRPADRQADGFEGRRTQKRIAALVGQRNAAHDELERLRRENAELHRLTLQHGHARLTSEERRAQTEIEAAQRELRRALQEQDEPALQAAQSKLTDVQVEMATIRANKQQAEQAARQPPPQQPAPVSPAMRSWMDENAWFNTDRAMTGAATGFHHEAVATGLQPETPAYFEHINKRMRAVYPDRFEDDEDHEGTEVDVEPAPRRAAAPASQGAAPRRNAQPAAQGTPGRRVIRLTADQRDAARIAGVTEQAYAAQLDRLNKAGTR